MRLDYDLDADALYIRLSDRPICRTVDIDDETMVDIDDAGNPVGIEVLTFARVWPLDEVLRRYSIALEDRLQLQAMFPLGAGTRRETPEITIRRPEPVSSAA